MFKLLALAFSKRPAKVSGHKTRCPKVGRLYNRGIVLLCGKRMTTPVLATNLALDLEDQSSVIKEIKHASACYVEL